MKSVWSKIMDCLPPIGRWRQVFGIELGAAHCRCVTTMADDILAEPSLAMHAETKERSQIACVGEAVNHVLWEGGRGVRFTRLQPFASPQDLDSNLLGLFLLHFRREVERCHGRCHRARLAITAAPELLSHIQPLLGESAATAGFRTVETLPEADCLQAALAASAERPALVVDVGETATRLYRVDADTVDLHPTRIPGVAMAAEGVRNFILERWRVLNGLRTIADLLREGARPDGKLRGRSMETGLPKTIILNNDDIAAALAPLYGQICDAIHAHVDERRLSGQALLIGGGARMVGLAAYLESRLRLPLKIADTPENVLATGLRWVMSAGSCRDYVRIVYPEMNTVILLPSGERVSPLSDLEPLDGP